jgi:hypothetical protein
MFVIFPAFRAEAWLGSHPKGLGAIIGWINCGAHRLDDDLYRCDPERWPAFCIRIQVMPRLPGHTKVVEQIFFALAAFAIDLRDTQS